MDFPYRLQRPGQPRVTSTWNILDLYSLTQMEATPRSVKHHQKRANRLLQRKARTLFGPDYVEIERKIRSRLSARAQRRVQAQLTSWEYAWGSEASFSDR